MHATLQVKGVGGGVGGVQGGDGECWVPVQQFSSVIRHLRKVISHRRP